MGYYKLIPSFNAGEISPFLDSRSDIEKYQSGCQTLENAIIVPYGGAIRRPGTEFMGVAKYNNSRCRLIGFNFSTTTDFILEVGVGYIRFWSNGLQVLKQNTVDNPVGAWSTANPYSAGDYILQGGLIYYCLISHSPTVFATDLAFGYWVQQSIVEVPTPYQEADLREVQYVQINDIMYMVHPSYPVQKLSRIKDDTWKFAEVQWKWPPFLDENITLTTVTPVPVGTTAWVTGVAYTVGQYVTQGGSLYICAILHTSGTFATDLTAVKWTLATYFPAGMNITLTATSPIFKNSRYFIHLWVGVLPRTVRILYRRIFKLPGPGR